MICVWISLNAFEIVVSFHSCPFEPDRRRSESAGSVPGMVVPELLAQLPLK